MERIAVLLVLFSMLVAASGHAQVELDGDPQSRFDQMLMHPESVDPKVLSNLLTSGIDPDVRGEAGTTLLWEQAWLGNLELVVLLIESGA